MATVTLLVPSDMSFFINGVPSNSITPTLIISTTTDGITSSGGAYTGTTNASGFFTSTFAEFDTADADLAKNFRIEDFSLTTTVTNYIGPNPGLNVLSLILQGNDTINGTSGNDTLLGGAGNDTYIVTSGDKITDTSGIDTVQTSTFSVDLANFAAIENIILKGATALTATGSSAANRIDGQSNTGANLLLGGLGNDTYIVGTGDRVVESSGGGTDTITSTLISLDLARYLNVERVVLAGTLNLSAKGNASANTLDGSLNTASNVLTGLSGNDTYVLGLGDTVVEAASGGRDTIQSAVRNLNLANFLNVEDITLTGTGPLTATGNAFSNILSGVLSSGANVLAGLGANDTYIVDARDIVIEGANAGIDTVVSNASVALANYANVENIRLTGTAATSATGSAVANLIDGSTSSGANVLTGLGGNDTYMVDGSDTIVEAAGGGNDTVVIAQSSINLANLPNIENFVLLGDLPPGLAFLATGTAEANIMNTEEASGSRVFGLGGNDTYIVGANDTISEDATADRDTVQSSKISLSLANYGNVENAGLLGSANLNVSGNNGANILNGNSGNNIVAAANGNDTLTGGAGKDYFVFNTALNATTNRDNITDFSAVSDTIWLENGVFTALTTTGALASGRFWASSTGLAHDADDRIVYNTTTGVISYDVNGNAAGGAVAFAVLTNKPAITAADFVVI